MRAATYDDVMKAVEAGVLRLQGEVVEGRRPNPKAIWRPRSLEEVRGPHQVTGYLRADFVVGGERVRILVHRLVWFIERGPIPDGFQINHVNGIKTDNRITNLELVTAAKNITHAFQKGLNTGPGRLLTRNQADDVRDRLTRGESIASIARLHGVKRGVIKGIKLGVTYKH